jgi:hypothetical protein
VRASAGKHRRISSVDVIMAREGSVVCFRAADIKIR